jgi:NAD(P)H-hydrate epimerase
MRLLPRIPTTAQLRSLEADWIKKCGGSWGQVLMEIAGRGAAEIAFDMWQEQPGHVAIFCGRGNNGGDGMVVARYLALWGAPVSVFIVGTPKSSGDELHMNTDESNTNRKIVQQLEVCVELAPSEDIDSAMTHATLIVDALLGTGLDRAVEGAYKDVIDAINRSGRPVLAVDLPSGINSDTGQVMAAAVRADKTVTFGYLKPGLLQHPAASLCGSICTVDIGLPDLDAHDEIFLTTGDFVRATLPGRRAESNKGTYGSVLSISGSFGMFGATVLAGESALRSGAGLCMIAAPKSIIPHLPAAEMIYLPLPETDAVSISDKAVDALESHIEKASAVILGPGLSQHESTVKFVHDILPVIADSGKPCIVDADALNAISKDTTKFPKQGTKFVLTPHPKELSRLMQNTVEEIQKDRISAARQAATRFGCTVVLKGSRTIVASHDGTIYINPTGNPGMATAGSGDVLSGIVGGFLAQGMQPFEAAIAAVYIHGLAGDIAAMELGEAGVIAGDICHAVPIAIANLREGQISGLEMQLLGDEDSD